MEEFLHITDYISVGEEETLWSDRSSLDNTKHSYSFSSSTPALPPLPHPPQLLFILILHTCSSFYSSSSTPARFKNLLGGRI